jgi:hypothetical protein
MRYRERKNYNCPVGSGSGPIRKSVGVPPPPPPPTLMSEDSELGPELYPLMHEADAAVPLAISVDRAGNKTLGLIIASYSSTFNMWSRFNGKSIPAPIPKTFSFLCYSPNEICLYMSFIVTSISSKWTLRPHSL